MDAWRYRERVRSAIPPLPFRDGKARPPSVQGRACIARSNASERVRHDGCKLPTAGDMSRHRAMSWCASATAEGRNIARNIVSWWSELLAGGSQVMSMCITSTATAKTTALKIWRSSAMRNTRGCTTTQPSGASQRSRVSVSSVGRCTGGSRAERPSPNTARARVDLGPSRRLDGQKSGVAKS